MNKKFIWVTLQKEMIHKYPDAPDEVAFLKNEHRHMFCIKIYISVEHNDRDIEFIMFKRFAQEILDMNGRHLENKSCEMLSDYLHKTISSRYKNREIKIEVSEDGENGSFIEYPVEK